LEALASEEELDGGSLWDCQRGEHQNSPRPFNFAPTTSQWRVVFEFDDYRKKQIKKAGLVSAIGSLI